LGRCLRKHFLHIIGGLRPLARALRSLLNIRGSIRSPHESHTGCSRSTCFFESRMHSLQMSGRPVSLRIRAATLGRMCFPQTEHCGNIIISRADLLQSLGVIKNDTSIREEVMEGRGENPAFHSQSLEVMAAARSCRASSIISVY
jgi:hypothetical protein